MKNLTNLLIATAFMANCCLISCSKQENLVTLASGDINTLKSKPIVRGEVFTVSPSGNYNDDSYAIQTAFNNAVAAGAGSTVQLTEGTFYLKYRIEVEGFDGFFKGAGKEKTIITTHDVIEFNLPTDDIESLIKFRHGNLNMSDLTIRISNPNPCTGLNDHGWGFNTALPNVITITGNSFSDPGESYQAVNATFNNVKFVGGVGEYQPFYNGGHFNVGWFVWRTWDAWDWSSIYTLHGDYKFTNCEFQTAYMCIVSDVSDGPCIIGGSASSGNKFEDTYYATLIVDMSNSFANVSYNHYAKIYYSGVQFWQGANVDVSTLSLSKYLVFGNDFEVRPFDSEIPDEYFTNGIALWDWGFSQGVGKKIDANISNNKIFLNNCVGGIFGFGTNDITVTNNKIWGNGLWAGIYCGIWEDPCTNWIIKGNNVQNVNADVAPIWLGPWTSNFTVIGGSNKTNVLDEGTGNILTGVNNMQGSTPGPEILEAMKIKHEMLKKVRGSRGR